MSDVPSRLAAAVQSGRPVVYTALVETRGSTPQKAGASMLVFEDGSQAGTLGGGCVEAEVKRRALAKLSDGTGREVMSFQLDRVQGWDDGLICGGTMKLLVDPFPAGSDPAYPLAVQQRLAQDDPWTEVVAVDVAGCDPGDRFVLDEHGAIVAARASGRLPDVVGQILRDVETRPRPYLENGLSFLPVPRRCRLVIVGAGHVGRKVAELAAEVGFRVWVVDDRDDCCSVDRFPTAERLLVDPIDEALSAVEIDRDTFCLIVTRGHNHDQEALFHLAQSPARYLGMIGSRRKIRLIFDNLRRSGIGEDALTRVHAPVGLSIGSQTVAEISISIVAELIACRNLAKSRT